MTTNNYMDVEDQEVHKKLYRLHIEVCDLTHTCPKKRNTSRYKECIRMLNGLEKTLERKVLERERRWQLAEESAVYGVNDKPLVEGWRSLLLNRLPAS